MGRQLDELLPDEPENLGLLAMMMLHDSRRHARINRQDELVTLEEQDRSLWDRQQIGEGLQLVEKTARLRRPGSYQIQAAIAAVHGRARTTPETDWPQIVGLYRELMRINPSPVIALNLAAAVAMNEGWEKGLRLVDNAGASGKLEHYYLFHAARADLLRRLTV